MFDTLESWYNIIHYLYSHINTTTVTAWKCSYFLMDVF